MDEEKDIADLLKAASGTRKYEEEEIIKIILREASRDYFNRWGRVWLSEIEKTTGVQIDADKIIEALTRRGYKVRFIDASGGILYVEV